MWAASRTIDLDRVQASGFNVYSITGLHFALHCWSVEGWENNFPETDVHACVPSAQLPRVKGSELNRVCDDKLHHIANWTKTFLVRLAM